MQAATLGGLVVIGAAAYAAHRAGLLATVEQGAGEWIGEAGDVMSGAVEAVRAVFSWSPPEKYRAAIERAEASNGLPPNLLARLLWTESRYNPAAVSSAGAQGIAQFMPATARELGIDPFDPLQAIPAAARYLASLYRQTGAWDKALAAYNWGIGNVQRRGLAAAPAETTTYYSGILSALGMA